MKRLDETEQIKETPRPQPSGAEARELIEEYTNDLRAIIKRLRRFFN
jgi:hypothetical protein